MADKLNFPRSSKFRMMRVFLGFRFDNALTSFKERMFRKGGANLVTAFGASLYSNAGAIYKLPDHVHVERSSERQEFSCYLKSDHTPAHSFTLLWGLCEIS